VSQLSSVSSTPILDRSEATSEPRSDWDGHHQRAPYHIRSNQDRSTRQPIRPHARDEQREPDLDKARLTRDP